MNLIKDIIRRIKAKQAKRLKAQRADIKRQVDGYRRLQQHYNKVNS